ncbi:MAG: argininosuccinate lyase [Nitrososphaerota archaeon]|nr:argininosuccinate lyase [Nitrososphaerota archaeon]MDG6923524.1 argininosuccinate lyase [Nitrososphaerota archaeon]
MTKKKKGGDILHAGRLGIFSPSAAKYTSSIDIDGRLAKAVISINLAHVIMLCEQGIMNPKVCSQLLRALRQVPGNLEMSEDLEDVHMNVEDYVISNVGKDVGGMLNLGKSRNDQVATALRITLREQLILMGSSVILLEKALLTQAAKNSGVPMPGYTHLQRGQTVTVGHQMLAHFDSLDRNFSRMIDCYLRVNVSPMGAGALASTGFDIDRERVADLLGFDDILENSLDAVSSRDFATEAIYLCAQLMTDLSKLAEEIILWTTKEFSFAEISDKHASTSSMMPQKKNAIVPEIFRARTSQVLGDLVGAFGLLKALPLSYNLDLQELTRNLWSAIDKTITSVSMLGEVVNSMKFNPKVLLNATQSDDFLYATELADYLVREFGIPFREAHGRVGRLVKICSAKSCQLRDLNINEISETLGITISKDKLNSILDPMQTLLRRRASGSPNPKLVLAASKARFAEIGKHEKSIHALNSSLAKSQKILESTALSFTKTVGPRRKAKVLEGASPSEVKK